MNKIRLLSIAVIGLLVLNLITLGLIFFRNKRPGPPPLRAEAPGGRPDPRSVIIQRLHLNDEQIQQYDRLIRAHQHDLRQVEDQIRDTKNELYRSVAGSDSSHVRELEQRLGNLHTQLEQVHVRHFEQIRALCKPEQMPAFRELVKELARLFARGAPPVPLREAPENRPLRDP